MLKIFLLLLLRLLLNKHSRIQQKKLKIMKKTKKKRGSQQRGLEGKKKANTEQRNLSRTHLCDYRDNNRDQNYPFFPSETKEASWNLAVNCCNTPFVAG